MYVLVPVHDNHHDDGGRRLDDARVATPACAWNYTQRC